MPFLKFSRKKSGIAFGGGGTRGIAHIGAIRALQENQIEFDYIAGNSAGSLAGAVYALGIPWQELYEFVRKSRYRDVVPRRNWLSYWSADVIEKMADFYLKGKTFDDIEKPFCAVAVDLENGRLERLCSGSVSKALSASCAVPGVFQPVEIGGRLYVDGGTLRSIPTETVRDMGAEVVVGINLNADRARGTNSTNRRDVWLAAYRLSINVNTEICERYADIMLEPRLDDFARYSLRNVESMLKIGEREVLDNLHHIKKLMK